jgi:dihydroxyacetone kinase
LHETKECQDAIETTDASGKKVTYYLVNNDLAKDFHDNICKETKKVTATGTVKKVDGKMEMTATKLAEVK